MKHTIKYIAAAASIAALFLAGCSNLADDTSSASGGSVAVTISAATSPASSSARSAYPSFDASNLYTTITATCSGCTTVTAQADKSASSTLTLIKGKTWTITADLYSDSARTVKYLTGSTTVSASSDTTAVSISVAPAASSEIASSDTGSISLKLCDTAGTAYHITAVHTISGETAASALTAYTSDGTAIDSSNTSTLPSYWMFTASSVAVGTYTVEFIAYDAASTTQLGIFYNTITVYNGMTTDTWYENGTSGTSLDIKSVMISASAKTVFYVAGSTQGTDGQVLPAGSSSGSGTIASPFATLQQAMTAVNAANDGTSAYTIVVDGTLTAADSQKVTISRTLSADSTLSATCLAPVQPSKALTLTITSLTGSATIDASSVTVSSSENFGVVCAETTDDYPVSLTLKDISIICANSTASTSMGVLDVMPAAASKIILDGCIITSASTSSAVPVYAFTKTDTASNVAPITVQGSTTLTGATTTADTIYTPGTVTFNSTTAVISGLVTATTINVSQLPSSTVTVFPYTSFTSTTPIVSLFGTTCTGFTADKFPLSSTDYYYYDSSNKVRETQKFNWTVNTSSLCAATCTYGPSATTVFDATSEIVGEGFFATAIDKDGQVYIAYDSVLSNTNSGFNLYTNGTNYSLASAITDTPTKLALCALNDGSGSLLLSLGYNSTSKAAVLYVLTPATTDSTTTYTATSCTLSDSAYATCTADISSLAGYYKGSTQYIFYSYHDATNNLTYPFPVTLAAGTLASDGSAYTLTLSGSTSVKPSTITGSTTDDSNSFFRLYTTISDMLVNSSGEMYMLVSDAPKSSSDITYYPDADSTTNNSIILLNSRGAVIHASADTVLSACSSSGSLSVTAKGWNTTTQQNYSVYKSSGKQSLTYEGSVADGYDDGFFAGPKCFTALKPKAITMADYGIYVSSTAEIDIKNGTAVYDLSADSLSFTNASDIYTYGYFGMEGSIFLGTSTHSYY